MTFEWDPVLPNFVHGTLKGYNLLVRETDNYTHKIVDTDVDYRERYYYVEGLKKYTNYTMWVSVVNTKGEGPKNEPGRINSTGEDGTE